MKVSPKITRTHCEDRTPCGHCTRDKGKRAARATRRVDYWTLDGCRMRRVHVQVLCDAHFEGAVATEMACFARLS
jgi:hypothetical protein